MITRWTRNARTIAVVLAVVLDQPDCRTWQPHLPRLRLWQYRIWRCHGLGFRDWSWDQSGAERQAALDLNGLAYTEIGEGRRPRRRTVVAGVPANPTINL